MDKYTIRQSNKQGDWMVMLNTSVCERGLTEAGATEQANKMNRDHIVRATADEQEATIRNNALKMFITTYKSLADLERAWADWRNDYYDRVCYEGRRVASAERALVMKSAQYEGRPSFEKQRGNVDSDRNAVNDSSKYYYSVICALDTAIKAARNAGDSAEYEKRLTQASDVMSKAPMV